MSRVAKLVPALENVIVMGMVIVPEMGTKRKFAISDNAQTGPIGPLGPLVTQYAVEE